MEVTLQETGLHQQDEQGAKQARCSATAQARQPRRTRDVRVLLQAADLVDGREHVAQLAQALGEELELQEYCTLVHLQPLGDGAGSACTCVAAFKQVRAG